MKFVRAALWITTAATLMAVAPAGASTAPTWSAAQSVVLPGTGTDVSQGYLPALSCPSVGNCVAAGVYDDAYATMQGLILNEVAGVWTNPITITPPGNAATVSRITPYAVSCGSAGNCAVVGSYLDQSGNVQGFVDNEAGGLWRVATQVSLPANALGSGQNAQIRSVVCSSTGNCSAIGGYSDNATPAPRTEGLVVSEVAGTWKSASEVTLPPGANADPFVELGHLACASAGNCSGVGSYIDSHNTTHGLVVNEVARTWSSGVSITLPANASAYPGVSLSSAACASVGNCAVIGTYQNAHGYTEGLTVTESAGKWRRAIAMKMPAGVATNPHVFFYGFAGISCPSVGNCSAGGQYRDNAGQYQGFFVNEVAGTWRVASEMVLAGNAAMAGANGGVVAVSCVTAGNCSAGAAYLDGSGHYQASTVNEINDVWQTGAMVRLPLGATTVGVNGGVYGLVCPAPGQCTATGSYLSSSTLYQGFTVTTN